ncbi:MAG: L-isoaspartyl protein carboxyl methyltransferase, partial [Patescibacteria group bacterium]|nr:L-isoaspartyl protein carboxyl methyltransferase [Patescibacteria group bacterium]
ILVSAAGEDIPEELITQLEIGGTMVMPVRDEIIRYTKKADGKDEIEHFYGFSFVPLIDPH